MAPPIRIEILLAIPLKRDFLSLIFYLQGSRSVASNNADSIRLYGNLATKIVNKAQNAVAPVTNMRSISRPAVKPAVRGISAIGLHLNSSPPRDSVNSRPRERLRRGLIPGRRRSRIEDARCFAGVHVEPEFDLTPQEPGSRVVRTTYDPMPASSSGHGSV